LAKCSEKTLPGHKLDFPDLIHFPSHVSLRSLKKTSWKNDADCYWCYSLPSLITMDLSDNKLVGPI
ncbi:hypothetical protein S83_021967, partial [Arachis hypogaea]